MTDAIASAVAHRPWPIPSGPWIIFQSWRDLLFAHWRVPTDQLRRLVPSPLQVEEFDGSAWVGLTPFRIVGQRARLLPPVPGFSEFPEMNLRTYVRHGDRSGIHFFTLDAASRLAVAGARTLYRLPYRHAEMRMARQGEWIRYESRRTDGDAAFVGRYRQTGPIAHPEPGTLEHFLTERYALFVVLRSGRVLRGDIHHRPWPLQPAEAEIESSTVITAAGIAPPAQDPLFHYSARQDTLIWPPQRA
jgi:uncharacterized protein